MTGLTRDQRTRRAALIEQCYQRDPGRGYLAAIQEGARQFRESPMAAARITEGPPAARQKAIAEAVEAALAKRDADRKAAKKAAKRATAEAAAARVVQERQRVAAQFTETAVANSLREASGDDLAAIISTALAGAGQSGPAARPAAEVTADPRTLSLEGLDRAVLAATGRSAGSSPFWGGSPAAAKSPFWRDLQAGGASKGTAGA